MKDIPIGHVIENGGRWLKVKTHKGVTPNSNMSIFDGLLCKNKIWTTGCGENMVFEDLGRLKDLKL